jgi:DNA-binding MarR family transcriptional regulator
VAKAKAEQQAADDTGVGALNDILGFHIRLAHGAAYRHFTETFADLGLTQKQVSALWLVSDHPGIGQSDLGRRLQMDRATVMAIVNRLAARGYVERSDHRGDARRRALSLLPEGAAALERARVAIRADDAWLKSRFTKREVALLIDMLTRIHG